MRQVTTLAVLAAALAFVTPAFTTTAQAGTVVGVPATGPSAEQWSASLNFANQIRTLSQKMAKEYFFIAADIDAAVNRQNLASSVNQFDTLFAALRAGDEQGNVAPAAGRFLSRLDEANDYWPDLKTSYNSVVQGNKPSEFDLGSLAASNSHFLDSLEKIVKACEKESGQSSSEPAFAQSTLASRQLMLSQKMAGDFMQVYLNINAENSRNTMHDAAVSFERTLVGFIHGDKDLNLLPASSEDSKQALQSVASVWTNFQAHISKAADVNYHASKSDAQAVAATNAPLFDSMSKTAARLARAVSGSQQSAQVGESSDQPASPSRK